MHASNKFNAIIPRILCAIMLTNISNGKYKTLPNSNLDNL